MSTTTEKYIKKAVEAAKKELSGNTITSCNFEMNVLAEGATQTLAEALKAQAKANAMNSEAMLKLAGTLKSIDACAIKITNDSMTIGGDE